MSAHYDDIVRAIMAQAPEASGITQVTNIKRLSDFEYEVDGLHFRRVMSYARKWRVFAADDQIKVEEVDV